MLRLPISLKKDCLQTPLYLAATVAPIHLSEALYWARNLGRVTESKQPAAGRAKRSVLIIGQFSHWL